VTRPASLLSSLTLASLIAGGAMLLWAGVIQCVIVALTMTVGTVRVEHSHLSFDNDGIPFVQVRSTESSAYSLTYTDLDGIPRDKPTDTGIGAYIRIDTPGSWDWIASSESRFRRVRRIAANQEETEIWFLLHDGADPGGCWLECYSTEVSARVACIGINGMTAEVPASDHRFQVSLKELLTTNVIGFLTDSGQHLYYGGSGSPAILYLAAVDGVRQIDLESRTTTTICERPSGFVGISGCLRGESDPARFRRRGFDPTDWYVLIRTNNSLLRTDAAGDGLFSISLPAEFSDHGLTYRETISGRPFVVAESRNTSTRFVDVRGAIFDVSETGELLNRRDYQWRDLSGGLSEPVENIIQALAMPTSLLAGGAAVISFVSNTGGRDRLWLTLPIAALSGLIAAWLCAKHQAGHGFSNRLVWWGFTFLFGVFGYLGYRFHRRWPPVEFHTITADEFVGPEASGIEVFA
jgi:hypothetical protein